MQNKFPLWKNLLLVFITLVGVIYALPNLYSEDPAIHITPSTHHHLGENTAQRVKALLENKAISYKQFRVNEDDILIRFDSTDAQLKASDAIKAILDEHYVVALNLEPSTPSWLSALGARPMKLGLDLRGGVHFLLDVDVDSVLRRRVEGMMKNIGQDLRGEHIRYAGLSRRGSTAIAMRFRNVVARNNAYALLRERYPTLIINRGDKTSQYLLNATISPAEINNIRQYTIEQTMSILRNRVNELGVAEAVVQQQGANRVAVDLPGIQDAARAKQILGGTATLEFRMLDQDADPSALQSGIIPIDSKLYEYEGRPVLLKRQVILSGDSITSALSTYDQQSASPAVGIQLGGGDSLFTRTTRDNIGKGMAIVYVESKPKNRVINGEVKRVTEKVERVISIASIRSALGNNFQITGLSSQEEASNLALLLRAGALPAAIYPVEERTVGPTLGQENIERGIISLAVGMLIILVVMILYYRLFGLVANVALLLNLVFLVALLSMIGATLTLPGIAGIVLTVGMAVDANVLIYERIREELRRKVSPQAAIYSGYERAFATIVDANVTTLIVALVLFAVGTGAVKGFAVTLSIGLLTSMLTGVTYTRAIVNWIYGGKNVKHLSIGI